jgi:hypothetical protein
MTFRQLANPILMPKPNLKLSVPPPTPQLPEQPPRTQTTATVPVPLTQTTFNLAKLHRNNKLGRHTGRTNTHSNLGRRSLLARTVRPSPVNRSMPTTALSSPYHSNSSKRRGIARRCSLKRGTATTRQSPSRSLSRLDNTPNSRKLSRHSTGNNNRPQRGSGRG